LKTKELTSTIYYYIINKSYYSPKSGSTSGDAPDIELQQQKREKRSVYSQRMSNEQPSQHEAEAPQKQQ